jgi:hypothetical protein
MYEGVRGILSHIVAQIGGIVNLLFPLATQSIANQKSRRWNYVKAIGRDETTYVNIAI